MKKRFFICSILLILLAFCFVGCNEVPSNLQGTYRNATAGSEWIVEKTVAYTDQALLYNYTYNGSTYSTFIIGDTNKAGLIIDPNVNVAGQLFGQFANIKKANKITSDGLVAGTALADYTSLSNVNLTVVGYQFEYRGIVYLIVEGCQHILVM